MSDATRPLTPGERLAQLADERPDEVALILGHRDGGPDEQMTWARLETASNRLAHLLASEGVTPDSVVAIGLPTCTAHVVATYAVLKLGACAMPVNVRMPAPEREHLLALARPTLVLGDLPEADLTTAALDAPDQPDTPQARAIDPDPYKAVASGGSTGRPKVIVSEGGWRHPAGAHPLSEMTQVVDRDVVYLTGPLFHNQAFLFMQLALFDGATAVLNDRFSPQLAFRLITDHGVTVLNTVPTVMMRMLRHDPDALEDLSSVRLLWHMAAMCPEWAKEAWITRLGAEKVMELWAATEITGITTIRGDEWLTHRGSVGRGYETEAVVVDGDGTPLPPGEVGELYSRFSGGPPNYRYLGADPLPIREGGFCSVGDLAWIDEEGYVYLADRRTDLIISGGSNIYPAEVEAVLTGDPAVRDAVVIGLSDPDLGKRVHAIVEPADAADPPDPDALIRRCAQHLTRYKVPRTIEIVAELPRNDAGKIRRTALRDAREAATRTES